MSTRHSSLLALASAAVLSAACAGGTASNGEDYTFENETGWRIRLDRARVTLGPVYLNVVPPLRDTSASLWDFLVKPAWAHGESHLDSGRVVGEVLAQVSFDALSNEPTAFPTLGTLTQEEVRTADVWFYPEPGASADAKKLDTIALDIAGQARRGDELVPFRGLLKLDDSWLANQAGGARGNTSVAAIRQVRGIPATFFPSPGGALEITFDVKRLLRGADFSNLQANKVDPEGVKLLVPGKAGDQVMTNLYQGLHEADGTYAVRWLSP